MKVMYQCRLVAGYRLEPGIPAIIVRLEDHKMLGPPKPGKVTRTSVVMRHWPEKRLFETYNSFYKY